MENEKTAIFIDGAFFIKRAQHIFGPTDPQQLANKLWSYSLKHIYPMHTVKRDKLSKAKKDERDTMDFHYALDHLYRIFFYDCPPLDKKMHHPVTGECIDFGNRSGPCGDSPSMKLCERRGRLLFVLERWITPTAQGR